MSLWAMDVHHVIIPHMMKPIALDNAWTCDYFSLSDDRTEPDRQLVPYLAAWTPDASAPSALLLRRFILKPTDDCVSYMLRIDSAPAHTRIIVNNQHVGDYTPTDKPFEIDVTPYVYLEDNLIAFRVQYQETVTPFSGVRLQPIPCE